MTTRLRRWSDADAHAHVPAASPSSAYVVSVQSPSSSSSHRPMALEVADEAPECVICLDALALGSALFTAECGHRFHFACLLENVNHDEANADKCPICRQPQSQWPEQTQGLVKAHPFCTNCGKRGTGSQSCDGCGNSLAHTPTAAERARLAATERARLAAARSNVVVECPSCRIRCLVSMSARGTLQCPSGHLFQLRMPSASTGNSLARQRQSFSGGGGPPPAAPLAPGDDTGVVILQCPMCHTRVQMPPGSQPGRYMCPQDHTFIFSYVNEWRPYQ